MMAVHSAIILKARRDSLYHCDSCSHSMCTVAMTLQGDKTKYETYLHSRPRSFEKTAVRMLLEVMHQGMGKPAAPGFGLHVVHLTDSDLLPELAVAKSAGAECTFLSRRLQYISIGTHMSTRAVRGHRRQMRTTTVCALLCRGQSMLPTAAMIPWPRRRAGDGGGGRPLPGVRGGGHPGRRHPLQVRAAAAGTQDRQPPLGRPAGEAQPAGAQF